MSKPQILVVEDESLLGIHLEDILTEQGFEVLLAKSGQAAADEIEADTARFCAVIADIRHPPGPDGWQLARRVRELVPTMPVIYITGNRADEWPANGVPDSVCISKPFVDAQIVTAIATLLNQAANDPSNIPGGGS
ncbi:response regulator [Brucella intermedia]|uniref:response regulator n=1 Tax=Brucella intermedia TaxID=94625 RepID=UPI00124C8D10|nr:response regulator [Brucella intermedia]KAB2724318.1 response regulator [Brucella intermedia]